MTGGLRLSARLIHDGEIALGPGKADLLAAVATEGSISAAARAMGLSYRRAWLLIDTMNRCFAAPLVATAAGGARGGGAKLTQTGMEALAAYRALEVAANAAALPFARRLADLLNPRTRSAKG